MRQTQTLLPQVRMKAALLDGALPTNSLDSVYDHHRSGRWTFLTRLDSTGRRTNELWIKVPEALIWLRERGHHHLAAKLQSLAQGEGAWRR